ncbi:anaerobic sulfite reductase subunit AsrA [Olsenella porci]|uniref:anaerobic sulfite reductase subunit AsrA n=1 Tax=Olsenella porci TaxID=2652279 RepID=UPI002DDC31AD|nr:anaerobic sulfite reductase subunit AsrA [Olsenella porci]
MGYVLDGEGLDGLVRELARDYLVFAPVRKVGAGRFTDVDQVIYDFVDDASQIELDAKSDYSFKELLTPLSQTLFYFTEDQVREARGIGPAGGSGQGGDDRDVFVLMRACDLHGVRRLDDMYLHNGPEDSFYRRVRERVHFALIGCPEGFEHCFCVDMGTNVAPDNWEFSLERRGDGYVCAVEGESLRPLFERHAKGASEVVPAHVSQNEVHVSVPGSMPMEVRTSDLWDEYTRRCIGCGRCTLVCPTCTCFTMQDVLYTENGRVGERRRVQASCMIDGYSTVAGGASYRKRNGERMRFKVLHKVYDFRQRFGYDMCVGCGRCDDVCPEYISFAACVNKVTDAVSAWDAQHEGSVVSDD